MSIKAKVILVIALCLAIGAFVLVNLVQKSYDQNVELVATQALDNARNSYSSLEQNDYRALTMAASSFVLDEKAKELFIKKDREGLYNYLKPFYEDITSRSGISIVGFIEPDKTMFLRMLSPKKFDDKIKMKVLDNSIETKDVAVGSELGKAGYALRSMRPYYDKTGKLIGYVLFGDTYDNFLSTMKKQSGDEYIMVADKSLLDEEKYHSGQKQKNLPDYWSEYKNILVLNSTLDYKSFKSLESDLKDIPKKGKIVGEINKDNKVYIQGVFPLVDLAGKNIGGVFVMRDITSLYSGMQAVKTSATVSIIILIVVISLILISILNKLIFARLKNTMKIATRVVGGEFDTQIVTQSDDEVGKLEQLLEQFRAIFVNVVRDLENEQKK